MINKIKKLCNKFTPRDSVYVIFAVLCGALVVVVFNIVILLLGVK